MSVRLQVTAIAALVLSSGAALAQRAVSFTVENNTGHTLTALYGSPSATNEWEDNFLSERVADGDSVTITIGKSTTCVWDFKYDFSDKDSYEEYKINICEIDGESFTIE